MSTPSARIVLAAERLSASGVPIALLHGEGWGEAVLAIEPDFERRVPIGVGAFAASTAAISELEGVLTGSDALAVGVFSYEAARDLERTAWSPRSLAIDARAPPIGAALIVRRFGAWARASITTAGDVHIEGPDSSARRRLERALDEAPRVASTTWPSKGSSPRLEPHDSDAVHAERIRAALALIVRGDLYQVCLARRFRGRVDGPLSELYRAVVARERPRFGAWLDFDDHALLSASPELFLDVGAPENRADLRRLARTSPIKGTRPRGTTAADDARLRDELEADPKERAELAMVVDLERNDLGRVCEVGSIDHDRVPRIESTPTVHHRVQDVVGALRRDVDLGALFASMAPSGSVTGAPKVRAMEVIAELEAHRRGAYCGAIFCMRGGRPPTLRASMAIRTLVARRDGSRFDLDYDAGGGVVADSDPMREALETRWKAACFDR